MSELLRFLFEHFDELKQLDAAPIFVFLALAVFAIWRFAKWVYEERIRSKQAVIGDDEGRS